MGKIGIKAKPTELKKDGRANFTMGKIGIKAKPIWKGGKTAFVAFPLTGEGEAARSAAVKREK